ncbi:DUF2971 domain-containing protein [Flavobacterium psychrophilum]
MEDSIDKKLELYLDGARGFFEGMNVDSRLSTFGPNDYAKNAEVVFDNKVIDYKIEPNQKLEIIHYTNLQSFCNIINSQNIRLYNCFNLNDSKEIETGLNKIGFKFSKEWLENLKRTHFVFSASEYNNDDDFNMWRLYGDNGNGVALVFEVDDNFKNWKGIHISKVSYSEDDESFQNVKNFIDFHNKFQSKHEPFISVPSIIPLVGAFQKNKIWSIENEFRIVATCDFDEHNFKTNSDFISKNYFLKTTLNHQVNNSGKLVSYLELPITEKFLDEKFKNETDEEWVNDCKKLYPRIKLKKIVFGHNIRGTAKSDSLIEYWSNVIPSKIGHKVEIQFSEF